MKRFFDLAKSVVLVASNFIMTHPIKLPNRLPLLIIDGVLFPGATIRIPVLSYRK